jgi:cyclopropane fatty-acyl-phospholipid synthase-like methyltransferase
MLAQAREHLSAGGDRLHFRNLDYETASLTEGYDAVVSALSIHYIGDGSKRSLFHKVKSERRRNLSNADAGARGSTACGSFDLPIPISVRS